MYGAIVLFLIAAFLGLQTPSVASAQGRTLETNPCTRIMARVPQCTKRFIAGCQRTAACTVNGRPSRVCTAWKCVRVL
jgi:hypothetical protein